MTEVGGCRPIYEDMDRLLKSVCAYLVPTLNAIWFCLGWCCIMMVAVFFVAFRLSGIKSETFQTECDSNTQMEIELQDVLTPCISTPCKVPSNAKEPCGGENSLFSGFCGVFISPETSPESSSTF